MIEVYLFVDPACTKCLAAEKEVNRITDELNCKVCLRYIPFNSLSSINEAKQHHLNPYQMTIDYKAALYQGCKKGRRFLQLIQELTLVEHQAYSDDLVYKAALAVKLDLSMFKEDRLSPILKETIQSDRELVQEMGINDHGNLVMFDCQSNGHGLLVEKVDYSQLTKIFNHIIKRKSLEKFKATPNLRVL
ncbi:DsbA family protein [Fructilactobacillus sp. Tb1]|uniref:DsbA family protein n=1 Tax=Fructilactobacillus sp. Tb1 TaxID=3422304 RepID=UPI003D2C63BD